MPIDRRVVVVTLIAAAWLATFGRAGADPAPFDLAGPRLAVRVTRGTASLPIPQVPSLAPGDHLVIRPEMPESQSAHYLMVAAFLRGPTNPPPATWFTACKTWQPDCVHNGLALTVPKDAQQLMVFFAPETGGDFKTLVDAVRGRPGAFVRSFQQLSQAALDHARLEQYLAAIRTLSQTDPGRVREATPVLAKSLAIKVDDKCLDRIPALQAACLLQGQDSLILNDGHSTSMVGMLTSGPASDLAMQAGNTALLGSGAYSSFIGSILDIGRLMDSIHTAQYQYIPALTSPQGDDLALKLNTPPSFHNPQSVLVVALAPVEPPQPPQLHADDASAPECVRAKPLVLHVDGAPLVYSTAYAHELVVEGAYADGRRFSLPARPDAMVGGLVVDTHALEPAGVDSAPVRLKGLWGFDALEGPVFHLANPEPGPWAMSAADQASIIVGRESVVHLQSAGVRCVAGVRLRDAAGVSTPVTWKAASATELEVRVPLEGRRPGVYALVIDQHGQAAPAVVELSAFADPGHLDGFTIHAGDAQGTLRGRRLEQVQAMVVDDVEFTPVDLAQGSGGDELRLAAPPSSAVAGWKAGQAHQATVRLNDGRKFPLGLTVMAPRPKGALIAKTILVDPAAGAAPSAIRLAAADELPPDAKLAFSVRTEWPARFQKDELVEVATVDGSYTTQLSLGNGGLTLSDARDAVATLEPAKAFGPSAFGPLQYRLVSGEAVGDWQPLATLVRLPTLSRLQCDADQGHPCLLTGAALFLIKAVSADPGFASPVVVPSGYPGFSLQVPRPAEGRLYLRLRDDPGPINAVQLPVESP